MQIGRAYCTIFQAAVLVIFSAHQSVYPEDRNSGTETNTQFQNIK